MIFDPNMSAWTLMSAEAAVLPPQGAVGAALGQCAILPQRWQESGSLRTTFSP